MLRFSDPGCAAFSALTAACSSSDASERALARNFLAEHRLSEERFRHFMDFGGNPATWDDIQDAVVKYHNAHVRPFVSSGTRSTFFRESAVNGGGVPTQVGTVLDLTGLHQIYADAKAEYKDVLAAGYIPGDELEAFANYSGQPGNYDSVNEFLKTELRAPDKFLDAVFKVLNRARRSKDRRFREVWVADWDTLKPLLDKGRPDGWIRAVGVPKNYAAYLAVLCFTPEENGLFRPSQLEAGWRDVHFVSPPQAPFTYGGHAMHLGGPRSEPLVREYLQGERDWLLDEWQTAGRLVGFADSPVDVDVVEHRTLHWLRLRVCYGEREIEEWMPVPV